MKRRLPLWALPNALSLDVPLIGVAWQRLIAQTLGETCAASASWVLGLSIWLAYIGDRWLDSKRLKNTHTYRHELMQRLQWPIFFLWLIFLAIDVLLALSNLSFYNLALGAGLLALSILYTFSTQQGHQTPSLTKEIKVSLILSLGVFIFIPPTTFEALAASALLFALLTCLLWSNASLIAHWEHDVDTKHQSMSLSIAHPNIAASARWITLFITILYLSLTPIIPQLVPILLAGASASILMFIIDACVKGRELKRVLADVALLTPIVFLFFY